MKSDILNFHLTNSIHIINDNIKNQSQVADKIRPTNFVCSRNFVLSRGHYGRLSWLITDCCNAQLQIPKRDLLLSFEHKRDRSYCVHNKNGTLCFMKLCPEYYSFSYFTFTHTCRREFPHLNLLYELVTTFGVLFLVFFFFIQISSEQQRRT